ncbi:MULTISPECIES: MFS transporter [Olivibacter]|uniref:Major facilitator superfamily MFS_1 n=3 Tax=Sphingobacteriaceae TaxID=84566 RepID=F4C8Q7_SPHS2|nr:MULTISPECIES: MFS transporter [Olivibacter]MCL4641602.1 MFS transporter [Olivibacter sp. UJ_SKK_5.1]MDM8173400.1 MFS transporter [Olivibacter sp. 47]MDX3915167.1 MFS transporter [Pseudosphingobacterium sp.]QEL03170.1 MFS transporter [Olivibacter sp. LS-1]
MKHTVNRYAWLIVALLWVVAFLNYLDRILITSMHDPIVADFKLSDAQFGLLTSVFLWSYGILSPFGGFFADKYSRKKVIVFSVMVWSAVTLWTGFASSFSEMLVARIIMGISEACYIPAALALITDYHRGRTRSLATGLHMSGLYAGLALGGIGGYIAELWGWRYGFHVFGIVGIVYSFILLKILKDHQRTQSDLTEVVPIDLEVNIRGALKNLFSKASFYVLLFYFAVLGIVNWLVYGWLPTFLKEHFHLDLGEAGISATGYIQIGSFIGVIVGGILADRWTRKNNRGRIYMLIIGFTLGAPFLFLMASTSVFGIAIIAMLIFGLARGFNDANLMPILRQVADDRYIATGYGFLNFLSTIVGGLMVYVGGALKDAQIDLSIIYQFSAVLLLLATWTLFAVKVKKD